MDREKVIKELEEISDYFFDIYRNEKNGYSPAQEYCNAAEDAIALLKEQEAVEPIPPTNESDLWKCGNCNHQLFRCTHQRYCEMCGKPVKWE